MISSLNNYPIYLLHWDSTPDGEVGYFLDIDGNAHEYAYVAEEESIYHAQLDSATTESIKDFTRAVYEVSSTHVDSDDPLGFLMGQLSVRSDSLKCEAGNVPCGKRCLPQGQVCRSKGGLVKGAAIAGLGVAGVAALGAGTLLAKTEAGRAAAQSAGESARSGNVIQAGRQLARGVREGGEEVVVKGAEKAGRYVGENAVKAATKGKGKTQPSPPPESEKEEGLASKAVKSFAKGAKEAATKEVKSVAKQKAQSIKSKIKELANKEIAYLPGERKLREKFKEATRKKTTA